MLSYFREFLKLVRFVKSNPVDLIHAHYGYSGFIAALTLKKTVCSLMGSDVFDQPSFIVLITRFFSRYIWKSTIVKSQAMSERIPNSIVIPNGVDLNEFYEIDQKTALSKTSFEPDCKNIIFVAEDIETPVKNFKLAAQAVMLLNDPKIRLQPIHGKKRHQLVYYYNAADLLLLTSISEGSPNVVKEAMACSCPIVATNVGDISEVIRDTPGCFLTDPEPNKVSQAIVKCLQYGKRTSGREKVANLDSELIAQKLLAIYKKV